VVAEGVVLSGQTTEPPPHRSPNRHRHATTAVECVSVVVAADGVADVVE
jgi:hypothetical protein